MTDEQKQKITHLRQNGQSYSDIAKAISLPEGTIKSFCWRNRQSTSQVTKSTEVQKNLCLQCGAFLEHHKDAPPRKFCNDKCRFEWWRNNRKSNNHAICYYCGKQFFYYGKIERKYCSKNCSIKHRFQEGNI